jgi:hypothetical protein
MPHATLGPTVAPFTRDNPGEVPTDWESPTGPLDGDTPLRIAPPTRVYQGHAEAHWRGQTCRVVGSAVADERTIVFPCGCRASVPWWTLEPIATR